METSNTFISAYDALPMALRLHGSSLVCSDAAVCFALVSDNAAICAGEGLREQICIQRSHTTKRRVVLTVFYAEDGVVWDTRFSGDFSQFTSPGLQLSDDFFKHVYLCHICILRYIYLSCQGLFTYQV